MSEPNIRPLDQEQGLNVLGKNYLHYNPDRTDYAINDQELNELELCSDNLWKDICLISLGIGIPTLANAITIIFSPLPAGETKFIPNIPFVLNVVLGIVGIGFSWGFGVAWKRSKKTAKSVIDRIRDKPRISLN